MHPRPLGNTGLSIRPIGFGAFKIGRNTGIKYPSPYDLPDIAAVDKLLNGVLDLGIDLIDTAPAYGLSEERIGDTIAHRRSQFILSTKVGETFENGVSHYDFSAEAVRASVERSLARLRTEQVDIVFVHSSGDDLRIQRETDCIEMLRSLRGAGLTRFIGFSGKTIDGARAALDWADVLMVEYHLNDVTHDAVMREAKSCGVGVVVKKGLAAGRIPPKDAIPFVLKHPAVTSMIIGGLNLDHIAASIAVADAVDNADD